MMTRQIRNLLGLIFLVGACGATDDLGPIRAAAPRPLGMADGGGDQADLRCQIVLRRVSRVRQGAGYETTCSGSDNQAGPCLYLWRGTIEVPLAALPEVAAVQVLFRTGLTAGDWYSVPALASREPASAGFARYDFTVDHYTPAAGTSQTTLQRTRIELIPYLLGRNGTRYFDHNRISDPFGSYVLELKNEWAVGEDASACPARVAPPAPVAIFDYPTFSLRLEGGPIVAGGELRIRYDGRRLREVQSCLGTHGPASVTTIIMGWRVDGGAENRAEVERYGERYGYLCQGQQSPCIDDVQSEPLLPLAANAKKLELWFYCVPGYDKGAPNYWKYDSNFGHNYSFEISPAQTPVTPAAKVDWAGAWALQFSRSGQVAALSDPHVYQGFDNQGHNIQAEVYIAGLTDQAIVDTSKLKAYVESDAFSCGSAESSKLERRELSLEAGLAHSGSFGNNATFRWGYEPELQRCASGARLRYRFLFSADGGRSVVPLGAAVALGQPGAEAFRTLVNDVPH